MYMLLWSKFTVVPFIYLFIYFLQIPFISNPIDLLKLLEFNAAFCQQNRMGHSTFCRYAFSEKAIHDVLILVEIRKVKL